MQQTLPAILSALPFVLLFLLIVWRRWTALKAIPLVWLITALSIVLVWKIDFILLAASFVKGLLLALEIMLIIFSAVWVITLLKEKNQISKLQSMLSSISPDVRIQAILIAWLFGSLIEGLAGFGTPAALTAPLLVSIGFAPFLAIVLSLIANSTAVSFGAAGTPILLGLGSLNLSTQLLTEVSRNVAILHSIAGLVVPMALSLIVIKYSGIKNQKREFAKTIPFIIFAWLSFTIPYFIIAFIVGPELPSILGGIIGLIATGAAAHYKFLTPKRIIRFGSKKTRRKKISFKSYLLAATPYLLIVFFLLISRIFPLFKNLLKSAVIELKNIFGTELSYIFLPLYTPSFYFILSGIIFAVMLGVQKKDIFLTLKHSLKKVSKPTVALIFALALVQLFLISSNNPKNLLGMPILLANLTANLFKQFFILVSPFIGAFGSFIVGSNTVSNLLFGSFQLESANAYNVPVSVILALQVVGGAIGNMIALHNILAAEATVGLQNLEWKIIRKTIKIMFVYALIVGLIAFIFLL